MIKAVAIDIDGTLTDESRRFDMGAVTKVRELEAMGIPVILATGNILCITESASFFIGTTGPLIAENGGIVHYTKTGETHQRGDIEKVRAAFEALEKKIKVERVMRSDLRRTEIAIFRTVPVEDIWEVLKDYDVDVVDTKFAIHVKDTKVSKGTGLVEAARMLGIKPMAVAAIGDSANDYEMLEASGYGIAVSRGILDDVADYVTKSTFGAGCVEAVEHLITKKLLDV